MSKHSIIGIYGKWVIFKQEMSNQSVAVDSCLEFKCFNQIIASIITVREILIELYINSNEIQSALNGDFPSSQECRFY